MGIFSTVTITRNVAIRVLSENLNTVPVHILESLMTIMLEKHGYNCSIVSDELTDGLDNDHVQSLFD